MIFIYYETIFHTKCSQGYYFFVFFIRVTTITTIWATINLWDSKSIEQEYRILQFIFQFVTEHKTVLKSYDENFILNAIEQRTSTKQKNNEGIMNKSTIFEWFKRISLIEGKNLWQRQSEAAKLFSFVAWYPINRFR